MKQIRLIFFMAIQLVYPAFALAYNDQYGMGRGMMGWGYSMGWPMMFFMLLFWGAVVAVIFILIRSFSAKNGQSAAPAAETPLDILKKRYAAGEIDQAEFEQRKQVLEE